MQLNFILTAGAFVPHNEIITAPEEKVELTFSSPIYPTDGLIISVRKGSDERQYKPKDGEPVDITELCRSAGVVEITASIATRGRVAKVWQIEPLLIKETPCGFEPVPQITALEERVATLEQALVELTKITT